MDIKTRKQVEEIDHELQKIEIQKLILEEVRNSFHSLKEALEPLVAIADAYDANGLDDEARKFWGKDLENENMTPPEHLELYSGRGGERLLTLAHCLKARDVVRGSK